MVLFTFTIGNELIILTEVQNVQFELTKRLSISYKVV